MCLEHDMVTRRSLVSKKDMTVWKTVYREEDGQLTSVWTGTPLNYKNKAGDYPCGRANCWGYLSSSPVKVGFCCWRHKADAKTYRGYPGDLNPGRIVIIKCIIPKGTKVSYGYAYNNDRFTAPKRFIHGCAPAIVAQRLVIPSLKEAACA